MAIGFLKPWLAHFGSVAGKSTSRTANATIFALQKKIG
jgi:hypothetical protein